MKHFGFQFGVSGGKGRGLSNYVDSADRREKIYSGFPLRGVRRIDRRRLRRIIAAPPKNPLKQSVLCEHFHLLKARQVEFEARVIAMTFALDSTCQATGTKRMLQHMQKCMKHMALIFCFSQF